MKKVLPWLAGLLTGFFGGLLGGGGGLVAVPLLRVCGLEGKEVHATSLAVTLSLSCLSAWLYLRAGRLDPFYGVLLDQQGHVAHGDDAPLSADQILTMNWLSDRVVGRIPDYEELTERGKILTKLQGVEKKEA